MVPHIGTNNILRAMFKKEIKSNDSKMVVCLKLNVKKVIKTEAINRHTSPSNKGKKQSLSERYSEAPNRV